MEERHTIQLRELSDKQAETEAKQAETADKHDQAIQTLTELVKTLQQTIQHSQTESPTRKPSSSKRPNNNATPDSKIPGSKWIETIQNTEMQDCPTTPPRSHSPASTTPPPDVGNQP